MRGVPDDTSQVQLIEHFQNDVAGVGEADGPVPGRAQPLQPEQHLKPRSSADAFPDPVHAARILAICPS